MSPKLTFVYSRLGLSAGISLLYTSHARYRFTCLMPGIGLDLCILSCSWGQSPGCPTFREAFNDQVSHFSTRGTPVCCPVDHAEDTL